MAKALDGSTITAPCMGGCGDVLTYTLHLEHGSPEISPPFGAYAYAGGHLCPPCQRRVDHALRLELPEVTVLTYNHRHGRTVSVFRTEAEAHRAGAGIAEEWAHEVAATNPKLPRKITDLVIAGKHREAIAAFNAGRDDEQIEIETVTIEVQL